MSLPPLTSDCWQRLAAGGLERIRTQNLGTRLLVKRLQQSTAPIEDKVREIHAYYTKWERGLPDEIAQF
jgi:hypothetical protein